MNPEGSIVSTRAGREGSVHRTDRARGFTLIELAVVLAVIAILAGVLTPMVVGYIDQARITRAAADVRAIATAIVAYKRDTGHFPIYDDMTAARNDTATADVLITPGNVVDPQPAVGWTVALAFDPMDTLLNTNTLGLTSNATIGQVAYRGPYLNLAADPWGNFYAATAHSLTRSRTDHAFVISAGPNGILETQRVQPMSGTFVAGGDDVIQRIQ